MSRTGDGWQAALSWKEEFTDSDVWLGGTIDQHGNERLSEDGLRRSLKEPLELLEQFDMPVYIREQARKYELIWALARVWQRK